MKKLFKSKRTKVTEYLKATLLVSIVLASCICIGLTVSAENDFGIPDELSMYSGGSQAQEYLFEPYESSGSGLRWTIANNPFIPNENNHIDALSYFHPVHTSAKIDQTGTLTAGKSTETSVVTLRSSDGNVLATCNVRYYNASQVNARLNMLNYKDQNGNVLPTHDEVTEPSTYALTKFRAQMMLIDDDLLGVETMTRLFGEGALENNQAAESIEIVPSTVCVKDTFTRKLNVRFYPADTVDKSVTWATSNSSIATVSADGTVTGTGVGTTTITATAASGVTDTCSVIVTQYDIASITIPTEMYKVALGSTVAITPEIRPANASNRTLSWSSSDTSVATVDSNGVVTGVSLGTAKITATTTDGTNLSASCDVTVGKMIQSVTMPEEQNVEKFNYKLLTPSVTPSDAIIKTFNWSSSNTNVATVDSNGKVYGKNVGEAVITAQTTDGSNITTSVTVRVFYVPVQSVSLRARPSYETAYLTVVVGESKNAPFTPVITPSNATRKDVRWYSSNTSVLTIDENTGVMTGVSAGTAKIQAVAAIDNIGSGEHSKEVHVVSNTNPVPLAQAKTVDHQEPLGTLLGANGTATKFVSVAASQVGYRNGTLSTDKSTVYFPKNGTGGWTKYGRAAGGRDGGEFNWCAAFVRWCAVQAGVPASRIERSCNANMNTGNSFVARRETRLESGGNVVTVYNTPRMGDLIYYGSYKSGHNSVASSYNITHVGIVESYNPSTGKVYTIEGNTKNIYNQRGVVARHEFYLYDNKNVVGFSRTY